MRKLSLKELNRVSVEGFKEQPKTPIVLVLDNIRSALNVGSAFRTADAFALEHIYLCGITATPPHREILKTAIGATASIDWSYEKNTIDVIKNLKKEGYYIYGIEQAEQSTLLHQAEPPQDQKIALVFGNEVKGVDDQVMNAIDDCLEIPQFGTKHSINVSVCIGITVWQLFQQVKGFEKQIH